ncbi:MAG: hypothetical protein ABEL76_07415 [Bradymonadaceae bacterium]
MDFEAELEELREAKATIRDKIRDIEEKLSHESENTHLERLEESINRGAAPSQDETDEDAGAVAEIDRVDVDPETGKPPRGARGRQIRQAIDVVTSDKEKFKAAEVFDLMKEADPSVEESQRAYLYSKLNDMKDDGELEKVARGTWRVID